MVDHVDAVEIREAAGAVDRKADKRIGGVDRTREIQAGPVRLKGGDKEEERAAGAFRSEHLWLIVLFAAIRI